LSFGLLDFGFPLDALLADGALSEILTFGLDAVTNDELSPELDFLEAPNLSFSPFNFDLAFFFSAFTSFFIYLASFTTNWVSFRSLL